MFTVNVQNLNYCSFVLGRDDQLLSHFQMVRRYSDIFECLKAELVLGQMGQNCI